MKRLLVIIPGFGPGNLDTKKRLLPKNIDLIRRTFSGSVDIRLFNYGDISCGCPGVEEIYQKGYVGQFLYRYVPPSVTSLYDYVMALLDDIELHEDTNMDAVFHNLSSYKLDILTPALTRTSAYSHPIMLQQESYKGSIRISAFAEFFCYCMTPRSYAKWFSLFDENTAWMWGIDMALYDHKIKIGICDDFPMHHYYKSSGVYPAGAPSATLEMALNKVRLHITTQDVTYKPPLGRIPWIPMHQGP